MAITELEGAPGRRNVRRLSVAPSVDRRLSVPGASVSATPVSQGVATPRPARSAMHELADALGNISPGLRNLADRENERLDKEDRARGRLAAERGDFLSLDDIPDASEAFREGAAAALGERLGFDAIAELQRRATEGLNDPNFDFEATRQDVVRQFFGADPASFPDPTLVTNALDIFDGRSAAVESQFRQAVDTQLRADTRDTFLSNAATKARALTQLDPTERLPTLAAELQAVIADGRKLGLSMDDINNQRIFIVEQLATDTGQLELFDVFTEADQLSGTALRDHPKWGEHVESALNRATSAVSASRAADNNLARLAVLQDDARRMADPWGITPNEVVTRAGLPKTDPRYLSAEKASQMLDRIGEAQRAELQIRSDLNAMIDGQVIPDSKRAFVAIDRIAANMENRGEQPERVHEIRTALYARQGDVDPAYKSRLKASVLSAVPEVRLQGIQAYRVMRAQNAHLAESLIDDDVRTTVRAWEGLKLAGHTDEMIAASLSEASAEFLTRRQEFLTNLNNRDRIESKLDEMTGGASIGNRSRLKDRLRDTAAAIAATGAVASPELAIDLAARALDFAMRPVGGNPAVRVDMSDVPFGMTDEGLMDQYRKQYVRPLLNNLGLDPDRDVELVPIGPGNRDVVLIDMESGVPIDVMDFNAFATTAWRRSQAQLDGLGPVVEAASEDAVRNNLLRQDARRRIGENRDELTVSP